MDKPAVEQWAEDEYREGVSPAAAMRQLCRTLGCSDAYPTLKRMMEDVLAQANRAAFDRSQILSAIDALAPEDAKRIRRESYVRNNPTAAIAGAGQGNN